ncbi:MAG TPA: response regulator transcription factor [Candidatus Sulfomarinibacteraceae bacterium]|nr:response regulator transcription factor [Candidatus Sulfomarinibacteraceae bacterium]
MNRIRVLIIDEHPAVCQALASRLDSVPTIAVVGSMSEFAAGLLGANDLQPDVILLELKTRTDGPHTRLGLDPVSAISTLLASSRGRIIVLTSYLDESERDEALQAGAKRYLLKDIDTSRLISEIEAVACPDCRVPPLKQHRPNPSHNNHV